MKKIKWFGHAGHFICSDKCRFHLTTLVGKYLISTVGELWPERPVREIHASVNDKRWLDEHSHLKGDNFDFEYMKKFGFEEIGCGRKYETMVFLAGKPCTDKKCGCGLPAISGLELDGDGYNNAGDATVGHMKMIKKYEAK
jgi:hypothetical protein